MGTSGFLVPAMQQQNHKSKGLQPLGTCEEKLIAEMTLEEKAGQLTILADAVRPCNPDINPEATPSWSSQRAQVMAQLRNTYVYMYMYVCIYVHMYRGDI